MWLGGINWQKDVGAEVLGSNGDDDAYGSWEVVQIISCEAL